MSMGEATSSKHSAMTSLLSQGVQRLPNWNARVLHWFSMRKILKYSCKNISDFPFLYVFGEETFD
jgi:hypothetical protein